MEYKIDPTVSTNFPYHTLYAVLDSKRTVIKITTSPIGLNYFRVGRIVDKNGEKIFSST